MKIALLAAFLFLLPAQAPAPALGQTLRIGLAAETTAADPDHFALTPNTTLRGHLFDALTRVDDRLHVQPGLAVSWSRTDDRTWLFKLRPGVQFSNGAGFGAADVVFSFCRVLNNKEELVSSFSSIVRRLEAVEAQGDDTVLIRTVVPEPVLLSDLASLAILPRSLGRPGLAFDAKTDCGGGGPYPTMAAFGEGAAAIGTGPFTLVSYSRAGETVLARNPRYWGAAPYWAEVRLTPLTAPTTRLAALLAGDQDLIEAPGTADLPRLRADPRFAVATSPTTRLIFVQLDTSRASSPMVSGPNPLRDVRVRQALSLALNRAAIQDRIMDGIATPAAQFLPAGMLGTVPGLAPPPYEPVRARALLTEAGFPNGFAITFAAPNNRYVNDGQIAQAVVQQWQRLGIKADVDLMPAAMYFTRRGRREFSAMMGGWNTSAAETSAFFRTWLVTQDLAAGLGGSNYGGWSDPAFDGAVHAALQEMDDGKRGVLLQRAGLLALEQMPVIPIHFENAVWAYRSGISYPGRVDQNTLAAEVTGR